VETKDRTRLWGFFLDGIGGGGGGEGTRGV